MSAVRAAFEALVIARDLMNVPSGAVKRVVDTATASGSEFGHAATKDGGKIVAWHVTDRPDAVVRAIKKRQDFVQSYGPKGANAELGPGLYVSAVPHIWIGRSSNKWAFLKTLEDADEHKLLMHLAAEVESDAARGRLTASEKKRAFDAIALVEEGKVGVSYLVSTLASQPYVIEFWKPGWLTEAGLEAYVQKPPQAVKVEVMGEFAELPGAYPSAPVLRALRKSGLAGAFVRGGAVGNAEMVVWSGASMRVLDVEDIT